MYLLREEDKMVKSIHIMYGLPGSGKTYWCSRNVKKSSEVFYINVDYYAKKESLSATRPRRLEYWFPAYWKTWCEYYDTIYIDGLFTTHDALAEVIGYIGETVHDAAITVHVWNPDRETCEANDFKRRPASSKITIGNIGYDEIKNLQMLEQIVEEEDKGKFTFSIQRHTVIHKPGWKEYFENNGINMYEDRNFTNLSYNPELKDTGFWYSESWCLGGSSGSYTGNTTPVDADLETSINEVYNMLISVKPGITLQEFIGIKDSCMEITEKRENDYYGGSVTYAQYKIDLQKMYSILNPDEESNE